MFGFGRSEREEALEKKFSELNKWVISSNLKQEREIACLRSVIDRLKSSIKDLELQVEIDKIAKGRERRLLIEDMLFNPQSQRDEFKKQGFELSGVVGEKRQELWVKKEEVCK